VRIRKPDPGLLEFLSRYHPSVRELMLAVRQMVLEEIPSASETVNDVSYTVTNAFTFSGRFKEAFCYVVAARAYVNLGFPHGTELPDPDGRLIGTGKFHRHIRIGCLADLDDPSLRKFIHMAADRAELAGGPVALKPQVVVRAASRGAQRSVGRRGTRESPESQSKPR
jgi:hypothetical protein